MKIKNKNIIEALKSAMLDYDIRNGCKLIDDYNNRFWRLSDEEIDLDNLPVPFNELEVKIENSQSVREVDTAIRELTTILDYYTLQSFSFEKDSSKMHIDLSFIEHLKQSLEILWLREVFIPKDKLEMFSRFNNLIEFRLSANASENGEIMDMSILKYLNRRIQTLELENVDLSGVRQDIFRDFNNLKRLSIRASIGEENELSTIPFLESLNRDIEWLNFRNIDLSSISPDIFSRFKNLKHIDLDNCKISISALLKINPEVYIGDDSIKKIKCLFSDLNENIVLTDTELEGILRMMTYKETTLNFGMYLSLKKKCNIYRLLTNGVNVAINDANELSVEELENDKLIKKVAFSQMSIASISYTREEYKQIRKKIDEIISQIALPDESDSDREKKIFAQIYTILGKTIEYDNSNDPIHDLRGLLNGKCVCDGYAQILKNVLACVGINSEVIVGYDSQLHEGHAWNVVRLDGKYYWTDLTNDAKFIKLNKFPLPFCMKSTKAFLNGSYRARYDNEKKVRELYENKCLESVPLKEQIMLFTDKKIEDIKLEDIATAYLMDFFLMSIGLGEPFLKNQDGISMPDINNVATEIEKILQQKLNNGAVEISK